MRSEQRITVTPVSVAEGLGLALCLLCVSISLSAVAQPLELRLLPLVLCAVLWARPGRKDSQPDPNNEPTDEALMIRYVAGDARAFETLMVRYQRKVYGFIWRHLRDEQRASEMFQDCFYKVIRAAASFDPEKRFSTWLFTIVRNTLIDSYKKKRLRMTSLSAPIQPGDEKRKVGDFIPDEDAAEGLQTSICSQLEERLQAALEKLNPDQKEVFVMRQFDGLQFAEIAQVVGCPLNTAKTRMRYALLALEKELRDLI
jgi:RNA polymerase sigma-70 factor (ECF subfamily)